MMENLRPALVLLAICIVAAVVLAGTFIITDPVIKEREKAETMAALQDIFPQADRFEAAKGFFIARQDRRPIGIVTETAAAGYGGAIKMVIGIDTDGAITGLKILSQTETPGLGALITDNRFTRQFLGKRASDEIVPKKDIDAITGATISSRAVAEAVRSDLKASADILRGVR